MRSTISRVTLSLYALAASAACSTGIQLTMEGQRVDRVSSADMPTGCNLLGDVAVGIPPDAARPRTEEQLHHLMRNKAGGLGATHLVVEMSEQRSEAGAQHYVGRGVAYRCPEPERPPAAASGGEAGQGSEGAEGSEGEPSEGEGNSLDDI